MSHSILFLLKYKWIALCLKRERERKKNNNKTICTKESKYIFAYLFIYNLFWYIFFLYYWLSIIGVEVNLVYNVNIYNV